MSEWWIVLPARYNDAIIILGGMAVLAGWAYVMDRIQQEN